MSRLVLRPGRRAVVAGALAGALVTLACAAPGGAAATGVVASASYGKAEIWLRRDPSDHMRRQLLFKADSNAAPRVLEVTVPRRNTHFVSPFAENLGLGLDASGKLTVVMQSDRGLYFTHVGGTPRLHRVPGTTRDDTFPSVFRGELAYSRQIGATRSSVRLGSLTSARARTMWSNAGGTSTAEDTAVGIDHTVAFVTHVTGASNGIYRAQIARAGGATKRLLDLRLGDTHDGYLAIAAMDPTGRRLTIKQVLDSTTTSFAFALPSGRKAS